MFRKFLAAPSWLAVVGLLAWCTTSIRAEEVLTIGSEAPAIDVEHWVQDGKGKFKPVTKFADGKVYVVEFWATWCGPCIASMPHLAQLQTSYADKGVQIVSISDEDLETVEKFLEGKVNGANKAEGEGKTAQAQTYKELTSAYCLTADPDRSVHASYMEAAGQNGIPTAFIVGKDSKVEWIGHPIEMDEPLAAIVAGKWDRKKFADEFKEKQELELLVAKIGAHMRKGDAKAALSLIEEAVASAKSEEIKSQLALYRLQIQLNDKGSEEQLPKIVAEAYKAYADQGHLINIIAWTIVQKMERGDLKNEELLKATRVAIEKAAKQGEGDTRAATLDTAAHVQLLSGDVDAAIQSQTLAISLASPRLKAQLQDFLDTLKQEKEGKTEKKADSTDKPSK